MVAKRQQLVERTTLVVTVEVITGRERDHAYELPPNKSEWSSVLGPVVNIVFDALEDESQIFLESPLVVYNAVQVASVQFALMEPGGTEVAPADLEIIRAGFLRGRPA